MGLSWFKNLATVPENHQVQCGQFQRDTQSQKPRSNALPLEPDHERNPELDPRLDPEPDPGPKRGRKFYLALTCYGAIALLATLTLDGKFRWVVWIFLSGLALKTYIATLKQP